MSSSPATNITFPPGRIVWGSLYKAKDKDFEGRPLTFKTGQDAGKPRVEYSFGVAIPKVAGQHWATSEWGKVLWQVGHTVRNNAGQDPEFSWKVLDGDSQTVGKRGRPCDKEGYPGHWIVSFSSAFAPRVVNGVSGQFETLDQVDYVNPGDYVQVAGSVKSNMSQGNPGILVNHNVVCFSGYGKRISVGVDASQLGFQTGAAGGGQAAPMAAAMPASVSTPPAPGAAAQPPVPPAVPAAAPAAPAATVVTPNASFTPPAPGAAAVPVAPGAGVPPVPAAPPARVMLPLANGQTYETFKAAGWTDEQLVQHGYMQA